MIMVFGRHFFKGMDEKGGTPNVRKSNRLYQVQQETRSRMINYITSSVNPLLEEDEEAQQGLTSDAFPMSTDSSNIEDPKEPSDELAATSPKDPTLGIVYSSGAKSTPVTTLLKAGHMPIDATALPGTTLATAAAIASLPHTETDKMASTQTANAMGKTTTLRQFAFDLFSLSMSDLRALFHSLPDAFYPRRKLYLPKKQKTLVLDLDETLIHSSCKSIQKYDMMIEVLMNKTACLYYVTKRPFVDYFLKMVSQWYRLVIFTASLPEYADPVIDWLDNGARILQNRFFRGSCIQKEGLYLKDLSLIEHDLGISLYLSIF
jgi:NLI interacting factor-like phosphatase